MVSYILVIAGLVFFLIGGMFYYYIDEAMTGVDNGITSSGMVGTTGHWVVRNTMVGIADSVWSSILLVTLLVGYIAFIYSNSQKQF